jgi:hypothetical protein
LESTESSDWFEKIWEYREETVYPEFFGSGAVELIALVGITDDEAQYARENDGEKLVELLVRAGAFPVTDPARKSIIPTLR